MLAQNERLEKRMMALEQHVQVGAEKRVDVAHACALA
jgi:hypothetical protein